MIQPSDDRAAETVRYKDGTTGTYGEFLEKFEKRTKYVMDLDGIKDKDVRSIVYVNSYVASLTSVGGKIKTLYIGGARS